MSREGINAGNDATAAGLSKLTTSSSPNLQKASPIYDLLHSNGSSSNNKGKVTQLSNSSAKPANILSTQSLTPSGALSVQSLKQNAALLNEPLIPHLQKSHSTSLAAIEKSSSNNNGENNSLPNLPDILANTTHNYTVNLPELSTTNKFNHHLPLLNRSESMFPSTQYRTAVNSPLTQKRSYSHLTATDTSTTASPDRNEETGMKKLSMLPKTEDREPPPAVAAADESYIQTATEDEATQGKEKRMKTGNHLIARRNTQEMIAKSIAEKHLAIPISEYAEVVKKSELEVANMDPQSVSKSTLQTAEQSKERERQIFALLWLMKNCESKHDSYVPRGRIFAQYASSCSQNELKPLSQASLGKLIRTVFPDLTTRRLGTRGQSKYHYCGLKLITDEGEDADDSVGQLFSNKGSIGIKRERTDNQNTRNLAYLDDMEIGKSENVSSKGSRAASPITIPRASEDRAYSLARENSFNRKKVTENGRHVAGGHPNFLFLTNILTSVFDNSEINSPNYKLTLPSITNNIIAKINSQRETDIDMDTVSSLESLYHAYCNGIFENTKFFKFDLLSQHLHMLSSGSVSPQIFDLYTSKELKQWIHECDMITHVAVVKHLSNLVINHNNVTDNTICKLENLVTSYSDRVVKSTYGLPTGLIDSKIAILKQFTTLLKMLLKLLRFITGFVTSYGSFKEGMGRDWATIVNLNDILEMVTANSTHQDTIKLIKEHISTMTATFLHDEGPNSLNNVIISLLKFISDSRLPASELIDSYVRFTNALIGDISLKSTENLLPWLFFNNITVQLFNYSFEVTKFLS
ncbi:Rfx1p KNAG_0I01300 [Huiozyma naganishii CBS 8797]|uniref:RFX-type winged-helix domain-containing protein n=1 Tax=Huiozyma naganishii (strain ATCC MYA-139 / BCRC 22969 / CBS 8797 / KCTC 17520 / NBRC 10181 / NCYC 3082 / Yp74L-3) TaxID=1071383 RepID=J7SA54_HUIN7|nr:hypothetical protein KNAG_0I01300 [Kazachstania naganishii CBS 8797]CCK71921.1 hypothetical protein KNAG_0I01300 [Kazachstania naganishii CBS 8797]